MLIKGCGSFPFHAGAGKFRSITDTLLTCCMSTLRQSANLGEGKKEKDGDVSVEKFRKEDVEMRI